MKIKQVILLRARLAFMIVFMVALLVIFKIVNLQFLSGNKWDEVSQRNRVSSRKIEAARGNIYSADGSLLCTSMPLFEVHYDSKVLKTDSVFYSNVDSLSILLAEFFRDRSVQGYKNYLVNARKHGRRYLSLGNRKVKYHEMQDMQSWPIFRLGQMKGGVIFTKKERRLKPFRSLARNTIGTIMDSTKKGVRGIEYSFEKYLAGTNGNQLQERVEDGNWKPLSDEYDEKPVHGLDVISTIDVNLQDFCESSLREALIHNDADNGCALLMETKTGDIKAIANLMRYEKGKYYDAYNYAVAKAVNPGSTFKLATMMALFETTKLTPQDSVESLGGKHKFYDAILRDAHEIKEEKITVEHAFEISSNTAIANLADIFFNKTKADQERFLNYLNNFGFQEGFDFQLKGSAEPKIPEISNWSGITVPWLSIGYEAEVSPLNMLTFYNAVANNGVMVKPRIVSEVRKANETVSEFKPQVIKKHICSETTLGYLQGMLEKVVESGTASNIKSSRYKIAGKTGTSQKIINGRYQRGSYYTSFVGYFPADAPKYSCIVIVDNPKKHKYGSWAAAPVFKKIADKVFATDLTLHKTYLPQKNLSEGYFPVIQTGFKEDLGYLCDLFEVPVHDVTEISNIEVVSAKVESGKVKWNNKGYDVLQVPNVKGMTLRDALSTAENHQLVVEFSGKGRVFKQSLSPGLRVETGQTIKIFLKP